MSGIFRLILGGDQKKEDSNTGSSEAPPQPESTSSPSNATDTNTASTTPAVESADEIRRKRLNMFSGSSGGGASPSNKTKSVDSMDTRDDFATPSKPVSNLGQRATPPSSITTTTRSTTPTKTTPTSASSSSSMEISKSPITRVETMDESKKKMSPDEKLIHDAVAKILKVSLTSTKLEGFYHLKDLASQLQQQGLPLHFTEQQVEVSIVERISNGFDNNSEKTIFSFLIECYDRAEKEISTAVETKKKEEFVKFLKGIKEIILMYCGIVLSEPDMFEQPEHVAKQGSLLLVPYICGDIPGGFLQEFVTKFSNDDTLEKVFTPILADMSSKIMKTTLLEDYTPYLFGLKRITAYKEIGVVLVNHPTFFPKKKDGYGFEYECILGPFFKITAYYDQPKVGEHYFGSEIERLTNQDVANIKEQLRGKIATYHNNLHAIFMNLLKPKETRDKATEWLSQCIESNASRAKIQSDIHSLSTEGFMTNITSVLLRLCSPFLTIDPNKTPYSKVQSDYVMTNKEVNFKNDAKMILGEKDAGDYYKEKKNVVTDFSFVTKSFFLTYRALHIGILITIDRYQNALKRLGDSQRVYGTTPTDALRKEIDTLYIIRWTAETHLFDSELLKLITDFYRFCSVWLIQMADPVAHAKYPSTPVSINLPAEPSKDFGSMSEFFIDDIIGMIVFLLRFKPEALNLVNLDEIFDMMCLFLYNSHYIKNPYVLTRFPELYCAMIPQGTTDTLATRLIEYLPNHKFSQQHLTSGLMKLYIDIEHGTSFYDKFNHRYYISVLLKNLWKYTAYKQSFINITKQTDANTRFMKFFNVLLNDSIYLLDESLKDLQKIKEIQNTMENTSEWNSLTQQQRTEKNTALAQFERMVKSYLLLANETVHMLSYLSRDIPQPFLRPEMVDRVASMLNYFLVELAGPQCQNLKVKDPEKYQFNPKYLLTEITDTYIHFSPFEEFAKAVARDERSFRAEVFERVVGIMRKIGKTEEYVRKFDSFALKALEEAKKMVDEDADYSDAPDEYLDPITYTIMEDPVLLPASKIYIDRPTIERHLLNDSNDPFNRSFLKVDMLIPAPELKQKIAEWKESKRRK